MQNFQGIIFMWTQTYREIFKSPLEYLEIDFYLKGIQIKYIYVIELVIEFKSDFFFAWFSSRFGHIYWRNP